MKPLTPEQITQKLQLAPSPRAPSTGQLTDPVVETPMQVTLEQLRPYEHNPRVIRNPLYDELKASIRERGLDQPPPITRRPGAPHYVIRTGGNTRLAILNELWKETRDEQFYRIHCLFRPWGGDLSALLGHLAENDLHGQLTFIERAIAVAKAKDMFEQGSEALSQRELSRKLADGGYGISQSNISRMFDTLEHLLPAIPQLLYQGLGRTQIERLIALRKQALSLWIAGQQPANLFGVLWLEVLAKRDTATEDLDIDAIAHDIQTHLPTIPTSASSTILPDTPNANRPVSPGEQQATAEPESERSQQPDQPSGSRSTPPDQSLENGTADRVEQIRNLVDQAIKPSGHSTGSAPLTLSPETAWLIEDVATHPDTLRQLIFEQAGFLIQVSGSCSEIHETASGLGFVVSHGPAGESPLGRSITLLLAVLSQSPEQLPWQEMDLLPGALFGQLMLGTYDLDMPGQTALKTGLARLPDDALLSLLRLIRLARTLVDLIKGTAS